MKLFAYNLSVPVIQLTSSKHYCCLEQWQYMDKLGNIAKVGETTLSVVANQKSMISVSNIYVFFMLAFFILCNTVYLVQYWLYS